MDPMSLSVGGKVAGSVYYGTVSTAVLAVVVEIGFEYTFSDKFGQSVLLQTLHPSCIFC